jgi:hypothetical protein
VYLFRKIILKKNHGSKIVTKKISRNGEVEEIRIRMMRVIQLSVQPIPLFEKIL